MAQIRIDQIETRFLRFDGAGDRNPHDRAPRAPPIHFDQNGVESRTIAIRKHLNICAYILAREMHDPGMRPSLRGNLSGIGRLEHHLGTLPCQMNAKA